MSVHEMAQRHLSFGYQVYFASEQSTAEIEAHVRTNPFELFPSTLTCLEVAFILPTIVQGTQSDNGLVVMHRRISKALTQWNRTRRMYFERQGDLCSCSRSSLCNLRSQEFEYYILNFQRGMSGPLSYYRLTKLRFEEEKGRVA